MKTIWQACDRLDQLNRLGFMDRLPLNSCPYRANSCSSQRPRVYQIYRRDNHSDTGGAARSTANRICRRMWHQGRSSGRCPLQLSSIKKILATCRKFCYMETAVAGMWHPREFVRRLTVDRGSMGFYAFALSCLALCTRTRQAWRRWPLRAFNRRAAWLAIARVPLTVGQRCRSSGLPRQR